mgnify:CR=1 FL=1
MGIPVGGTNPSLLEAMACGCNIAAHENVFNNAILGDDCDYFSDPEDIKNYWSANGSQYCYTNIKHSILKVKKKHTIGR